MTVRFGSDAACHAASYFSCWRPDILGRTAGYGRDQTFRDRDYVQQQNAGILPDLQTLARQPRRSAITQLRRRLLGMRRRYRSRNGLGRFARLRTQRMRGRTSPRLDRSIQALIWPLHYDRFGSVSACHGQLRNFRNGNMLCWLDRPDSANSGQSPQRYLQGPPYAAPSIS